MSFDTEKIIRKPEGDTIVAHHQLSPQEYDRQRILSERADMERYAEGNKPTYGTWNPDTQTFVEGTTNPEIVAERNAMSEMTRTGIDRYYHPNSPEYFATFQGIKNKYLQQELSKKAAIENEGKQLYKDRMGAFDKLIGEQHKIQEEQIKGAGLEEWRKAQADAIKKGDGLTPYQRGQLARKQSGDVLKAVNDTIKEYRDIMKQYQENPGIPKPENWNEVVGGLRSAEGARDFLLRGGNPDEITWGNKNKQPTIQAPQASGDITVIGPDGRTYVKRPKAAGNQPTSGKGIVFEMGETGLGATPEKKVVTSEDRMFLGVKRNR